MKIAFVHLSDIHISSNRDYDKLSFSKKLDFLNDPIFDEIDDIALIITGDITNNGKYENYKLFGKIIDSIKEKVKELHKINLKVIAVPGNHDLEFTQDEISSLKCESIYNPDYELGYIDDQKRLQSYKNFCTAYSIPYVDYVKNHTLRFENNFSVEFVLMNSSNFSRFNHIDYGRHYIPSSEIHKIGCPTESDIKMGVIHHTLSWFEQESKNALINTVKNNIQVMFFGHEHNFEVQEVVSENDEFDVLSVNGGPLYDKNEHNSIFNICILDTISSVFSVNKAFWNQSKKVYEISFVESKTVHLSKGNKRFKLSEDKYKEITYIHDNRDMDTFYIFPDMEYQVRVNGKYKKIEIHNLTEYLNLTSNKKFVEITGKNHNGKTAFARKIFSYYYKQTNKIPIILDALNCQKKYDNWEKEAFDSFYGLSKYDEFCRLKTDERILIIDNFHILKKDKALSLSISQWLKKYSQIIFLGNKRGSESLSAELTSIIDSDGERIKLDILNLKPKKRRQMIYNVCLSDMSHLSLSQINNETNDIEQFLRSQPSFVKFDPVLVMRLTSKYINNSSNAKIDVFHDVFATSLVDSIKQGFNEDFRLGEILLSKIAYKIFKMREYPFRRSVIDDVILEYNNEYGQKLDCDEYYDLIKNTKLIKKMDENSLVFESSNHLSFYIAREIQRLKNEEDDYQDYNYLINNISTGINGDIILYLSLLENSIKEGYKIVISSRKNLQNVKLLSLSDLYNSSNINTVEIKVIDSQETEDKRHEKNESKNETVEKKEYYELEKVNFFDPEDQSPQDKQVANAITYLDLNCKLFSSFYRDLKLKEKNELLSELYIQSNQTLYLIIKPFVDRFEEIKESVVPMLINENGISNEKADKLFEQLFIFLEYNTIIDIYNMTAVFSTCKQNIDDLINFKYDLNNELFSIFNLLFIQRKNEKTLFYDKVKSVYTRTKNPIIKSLVVGVFNRYLILNKVKIYSEEQGVISILKLKEKELRLQSIANQD